METAKELFAILGVIVVVYNLLKFAYNTWIVSSDDDMEEPDEYRFTPQELAIKLSEIDWTEIQVGHEHANFNLWEMYVPELMKHGQKDAIRILLAVMEARQLANEYDEDEHNPFTGMLDFPYLESHLQDYKPNVKNSPFSNTDF